MTVEIIGTPQLDNELGGVKFRLWVDEVKRSFLVSEEALADLIGTREKFDLIRAYNDHQDRIHSVAERLVRAQIEGNPIVITTAMLN